MSEPGRHRRERPGSIPDDVARQAAYLADHVGHPAREIGRRLRALRIITTAEVVAAHWAIMRGRRLRGGEADGGGPSILTVDEQLDALARGEDVSTPLRGMLRVWQERCRENEDDCGPRFCQCGELIRRCPPVPFPWAGTVTAWVHVADGSPVCPRLGPDGWEPAEPPT